MTQKEVTFYTDGACAGNPGAGGYGVVMLYGEHEKELSGGYRLTTNNRMELMAVIKAFESLQSACTVTLYTDSSLIVKGLSEGWVETWQRKNWHKSDGQPVKNADLWQQLLQVLAPHEVEIVWVKGHAGNWGNERADTLSYNAIYQPNLAIDHIFEAENPHLEPPVPDPPAPPAPAPAKSESKSKEKITMVGQPCRKCQTPVIKKIPKRKRKPNQVYYYDHYLYCPNCRTMYFFEDAKRFYDPPTS